jgi:hypothetical protein
MRRIAAYLFVALFAAGCKQPLGARCQVNEDCESGVCSIAEPRTCRAGMDPSVADAAPPADAKVDAPAAPDGSLPILDAGSDASLGLPDAAEEIPDAAEEIPDAAEADAP